MFLLPAAAAVLVVAPPTLQRRGLLATLGEARPDLSITTTTDLRTLPERVHRDGPALLILDAALPGIALDKVVGLARAACPNQRILVLGGKKLPFAIARLIVEMGGGLLLSRRITPADLMSAVAELIGPPPEPPTDVRAVEEPQGRYAQPPPAAGPVALFSPRELEVLQLVAADHSSQEIAAQLFISVRTVETHRRLLLEKAGTRSMIGLLMQAVRNGWLQVA